METPPHCHQVTIYYEDTDLSGYVYHPNYLKYFERAREHVIGPKTLATLYRDTGIGFVVYRCEMNFKAPAVHADLLDILSTYRFESSYRIVFDHTVTTSGNPANILVTGVVEMVCVDKDGKLVEIPSHIRERLSYGGT